MAPTPMTAALMMLFSLPRSTKSRLYRCDWRVTKMPKGAWRRLKGAVFCRACSRGVTILVLSVCHKACESSASLVALRSWVTYALSSRPNDRNRTLYTHLSTGMPVRSRCIRYKALASYRSPPHPLSDVSAVMNDPTSRAGLPTTSP